MVSRCVIMLRAVVVISLFLQQCISEEIICNKKNPKCLLQDAIHPGESGYLAPKVIDFFYKDAQDTATFSWKMDPSTNVNLLKGFQMKIVGINYETNGINDVIFFKTENVNAADSFRFGHKFPFPGDYKVKMFPIPTDINLSNKIEKDITFVGAADITGINLVNAVEIKINSQPVSDLAIGSTPINPFTATLTYPQVASSIRSRIKGYHTLVTCVLGEHSRYYYGVFGTDIDANTNNDAVMQVSMNSTHFIPGYYDIRVTPYMDTPLQQCRKPNDAEQPCKSALNMFPIGHFVCIPNGEFSMKCHELATATSDHPSFIWAMKNDVMYGSYRFTTEFSSKQPLPTTRLVFSCLRKDKNVEQCVDLQNTLESCCILPKQCNMLHAPSKTSEPQDYVIPLAIAAALLVAFAGGIAAYKHYY